MRIRPFAAIMIAVAALAGCATPAASPETVPTPTETTPAAEYASPEITETAFGPWGESDAYTWVVVLIENPNEHALVSNARVEVDFRGASGSIDTYGETIDLLPGITAFTYVTIYALPADVVAIDAEVVVDPDATFAGQIFLPPTVSGSFEVTDLAIVPGSGKPGSESPVVSGFVHNDIGRAVEGPRVSVVMRDASGTIIGADTARVENALGMLDVGEFEEHWFASDIPGDDFTLEGYAYLPFVLLGIDVPSPE
jgi:hypothetical protein